MTDDGAHGAVPVDEDGATDLAEVGMAPHVTNTGAEGDAPSG